MADNKEHKLDQEFGGHDMQPSGEDGACLTRHVTAYTADNSCSHRWQAYRAAQDNADLYNWGAYRSLAEHPYKEEIRTTVNRNGKKGKFRVVPAEKNWDLDEQNTVFWGSGGTTKTIPNFREYATIPYYHNAHHLIPNSVLNGCLLEASNTDMRVFALARKSLLDAKYNINHKTNMVILPMSKYVAAAMHLPRHVSGIETEPGAKPDYCDHSVYSTKVRQEVKDVISDFASQVNFSEHDVDAPEIAKALLEDISKDLLQRIRDWGKVAEGRNLNQLPTT